MINVLKIVYLVLTSKLVTNVLKVMLTLKKEFIPDLLVKNKLNVKPVNSLIMITNKKNSYVLIVEVVVLNVN